MAERLGNGLQNRVQRFDSAWDLKPETRKFHLRKLRVFTFYHLLSC